ncbi:c-type cytochrome [Polyangium mundeleinium]|uniref:C-type cytochrome n=1 Tax=Polyangium mundeleinium TaxID=2995306 RepID=A0ABT5EK79_9BACT|nr:hypothetical protein [Polyangium mundeleinium]MDC0742245.1 hypothetical protein [Polyangium mundeleinium]
MRRARAGIPLATFLAGAALASCGDGTSEKPPTPEPFALSTIEGPAVAYVGENTCFSLAVKGGPSAQVAWNLGDGTAFPPAVLFTKVCHVYTTPGRRLVGATAISEGQKLVVTRGVAVVQKPMAIRPNASSTIVLDPKHSDLWVANTDHDHVARLETELPPVPPTPQVSCDAPRTLAISGATLAAACQGDGTVVFYDLDKQATSGKIEFGPGSAPFGIVADPRSEGVFFVTLSGTGELAAVRAEGNQVLSRIPVFPDVRGVAAIADGTVLVTRWRATAEGANVAVIDATNPAALKAGEPLLLPPDTGLDSDTNNSGVPSFLNQIVPSPDGGRALVPSLRANTVTGMYRTGKPLSFETTARAILTEIELGGPTEKPFERKAGRYAFDDLDFASAVVFSPEGDVIYVAIQGAERVEVRDAVSFDVAGSIDDVGHAPDGLVLSEDGKTLWVHASLSREVRVYDVRDLSSPPVPRGTLATGDSEPLSDEVLRGKQIFYSSRDPRMSRTSYMSCATCHLDGEGDNLVWDFTQRGEGLRNTIPLAGRAGTAHGPLHWSANFDEVQDFEHDIRGPMGGAGFLPDDVFHSGMIDQTLGAPKDGLSPELDALATYVASLGAFGKSPYRSNDPSALASRQKGKDIFFSAEAGCSTCHAPPRFTDSALAADKNYVLHDVGTLGPGSGSRLGGPLPGLDTPTLRGLWKSAPYLHDGSALTLRAVLRDRNAADQHGKTSHLGDADLDDLERYLLTLDDDEP